MDDSQSIALNLLQKLYSLQEERVHTYRLFDEGHKIYLSSAPCYDFIKFRQLVKDVTEEFKRISEGIITIERQLRIDLGFTNLADYVSELQENEQQKLELTAKLQLVNQDMKEKLNSGSLWDETLLGLKQELRTVVGRINEILGELRFEMDDLRVH